MLMHLTGSCICGCRTLLGFLLARLSLTNLLYVAAELALARILLLLLLLLHFEKHLLLRQVLLLTCVFRLLHLLLALLYFLHQLYLLFFRQLHLIRLRLRRLLLGRYVWRLNHHLWRSCGPLNDLLSSVGTRSLNKVLMLRVGSSGCL